MEASRQFAAAWRFGKQLIKSWPTSSRFYPYKAEFLLTSRCNSRCQTCGCWRRQSTPSGEITADQVIRMASSLSNHLTWIGLSGGEPTLRSDLADIAEGIAEACPNLALLNFGTNGLDTKTVLSHAIRISNLNVPLVICAVSIDGIGDVHDKMRGVKGAFARVINTIDALIELDKRDNGFEVVFQTTVSPVNSESLGELANYLHDKYPRQTHIATSAVPSHLVGRGSNTKAFAGSKEALAIRNLAKGANPWSPLAIIPQAYFGLTKKFLDSGSSPIPCSAPRDILTIDSSGYIRPCDFLKDPLANASDYGFDLSAMLHDPLVQTKREELLQCRACFSPCQAYPSLMRQPWMVMKGVASSLSWRVKKG